MARVGGARSIGAALVALALNGADPWLQNGLGGQGGHGAGRYDRQAFQPTATNWVRQSTQRGPGSEALCWTTLCGEETVANPTDAAPGLAVGRDGTVYAAVPGCGGGRLCALKPEGGLRWCHALPGRKGCFTEAGLGSPIIAEDGTLFVQSSCGLFAVTAAGARQWSLAVDQGLGPFQVTPALGPDGTLYVAGAQGTLMAVRAQDGRVLWNLDSVHLTSSPVLAGDGTLYVLGRSGTPRPATTLFAVQTGTVAVKWTVPLGTVWPYATFVPVLDREGDLVVGEGKVREGGRTSMDFLAIRPDGRLRWRVHAEGESRCGPVLGQDGTVIVCTTREILGLDPDQGQARWRFALPEHHDVLGSTPIVDAQGALYVATRLGQILVLSDRGEERWRGGLAHLGMNPSSPALGPGGRLYLGTRTSSPEQDQFFVVALGEATPR
jgi:outer membrane protein assembly factor BamB